MLTPDQFKANDWVAYIISAVGRETGTPWKPPAYVKATWGRILRDWRAEKVDPWLLACAVDLLAARWRTLPLTSPWELGAAGFLLRPLDELHRPHLFWRYVWFSRYARTAAQVAYYVYWLAQYEAALDVPEGTEGRRALVDKVAHQLGMAEAVARERDAPAAFKLNWLRDWSETCRP